MSSDLQRLNQVAWQQQGDLMRLAALLQSALSRYPNLNEEALLPAIEELQEESSMVRIRYYAQRTYNQMGTDKKK